MQPDGPYRFTETMGVCLVGKAWWAVDGQGRPVTVAVLEGAAAADQRWREAFANAAEAMSKAATGPRYERADFSASYPWVAYPSEGGLGAQHLFRALGMELHPEPGTPPSVTPTTGPSAPVSLPSQQASPQPEPSQPVSAPPQPVSSPPQPAMGPTEPVSAPPQPVSVPPQPMSLPSQPVSVPPQPVSVPPQSVSAPPSVGGERQPWPAVTSPVQEPWSADPAPYDPFSAPVRRIQPSPPPKRRTGLWVAVVALVLVLVATGGGLVFWFGSGTKEPAAQPEPGSSAFPPAGVTGPSLKPWALFPPNGPEERSLATAAPSLVFIEAVFTGYLRDRATKAPVRATPITFNRRCSGFVVTTGGHVLTSSSCVQPSAETVRQIALDAAARMLVREGTLASGQVDNYIKSNLEKTEFTGIDPGSAPTSQLYGQLNDAKGNAVGDPAIPAELVKARPAESGNTALIKLARENLPVVELSGSAEVKDGGSLLVVGFGTDDTDFRTASYTPRPKLVTVTGTARRGDASMYRINDDVGANSHGGLALDPSGRVVGMVDQDLARPDRANRVVLPTTSLLELLTESGVKNELGAPDRAYRDGLDAYFAGRHSTAVSQLEKAATESPTNLLAQAYRQIAAERQKAEDDSSGRPIWPIMLLGGVAGALIVGLVVLIVRMTIRRR
ncbi:hypothetical protein GCM10027290_06680 [Micromonospora sonneratiae]|uniref:Trypsin-like peptidase domain-containing protein n=1 Tax=Micromonospora sonneratiae TaxID=1184706 RepID=A0ABW3Y9C4_9ACTN